MSKLCYGCDAAASICLIYPGEQIIEVGSLIDRDGAPKAGSKYIKIALGE